MHNYQFFTTSCGTTRSFHRLAISHEIRLIPKNKLEFGELAFISVAAANAWNDLPRLPLPVRAICNTDTCKQQLRTYLSSKFYD